MREITYRDEGENKGQAELQLLKWPLGLCVCEVLPLTLKPMCRPGLTLSISEDSTLSLEPPSWISPPWFTEELMPAFEFDSMYHMVAGEL